MKRAGFTMIELIFVIVILGILGAVAIPKLSGVKDDAILANANENFCIAMKSSLLNRLLRTDTLVGFDINNSVTLPADFSYSNTTYNGVLTSGFNLNAINDTDGLLIPAVGNANNSVYVYFIDGNSTEPFSCAIGSAATSTMTAQAVRDKIAAGKGNYI